MERESFRDMIHRHGAEAHSQSAGRGNDAHDRASVAEESLIAPALETGDVSESLQRLADLHSRGLLTAEEFASAKAAILRPTAGGAAKAPAQSPAMTASPPPPAPASTNSQGMGFFGKAALVLFLGFAAFLGYGMILSNSPEGSSRADARAAIDLCWQEFERKSLTPADKRFIAGACEQMEADFKQKYRVNP